MTAIIETVSGRMVDVRNPRPEDFNIRDIATSLGNLCRFNGQVKRFYSVAEHSVIMADNVPAKYGIYALLHDAAEAYVSDIVRPLKETIPGYKDLETLVLVNIVEALGLPAYDHAIWEVVEEADKAILAMEKEYVMASSQHWPHLDGVRPMDDTPRFWAPTQAAQVFMAAYEGLRG